MTDSRVDLAITNAHLWRETARRDLYVTDGRYVPAPSGGAAAAARVIDAGGRLCVAGFLEPHVHLDKAQINDDVRPQPLRHPRRGDRDHLGAQARLPRGRDRRACDAHHPDGRRQWGHPLSQPCGCRQHRRPLPARGRARGARAYPRHRGRADRRLPAGGHPQGQGHGRPDVEGDGSRRRSGRRHALQRDVAGGQCAPYRARFRDRCAPRRRYRHACGRDRRCQRKDAGSPRRADHGARLAGAGHRRPTPARWRATRTTTPTG